MSLTISLNASSLEQLDLTPVVSVIEPIEATRSWLEYEQTLAFDIDYPRDPSDPRELSEVPEVRLWFVRLDARYPWLPFLLNWKEGELARYAAMLIPHQFHPTEGICYNPEALEIFVMSKTFTLLERLKQEGIEGKSRIKAMAQMLGYELVDEFFDVVA